MAAFLVCMLLVFGFQVGYVDAKMNFLLIAVDDLRPQFGQSFATPEVITPNIDGFFLGRNGSAMQHSYVQIAVCGPSRSSILTGRRPDSTWVTNTGEGWCWCLRGKFLSIPRYLKQQGYVTAGNGKIFHPEACTKLYNDTHANGDDYGAWTEPYFPEPECVQWGSVPCPQDAANNGTMGLSYAESSLSDDQITDGQLALNAIARFNSFSARGIGKAGGKPFFHAVGLHKPHLPHIVPKKYFDMYPGEISLPPNPNVPVGFNEENWHADGNFEMESYNNNHFGNNLSFVVHVNATRTRALRRGYFAAVSFVDVQIGNVVSALESNGYMDNTVVALWSDHGWHLGDTNSWCKMTNFETAARNTLLWRVPGQTLSSQGKNTRMTEMIDFYPTVIDLLSLPPLPRCQRLDQPPTIDCLQGESYADEFIPALLTTTTTTATTTAITNTSTSTSTSTRMSSPKQYAFTQWPYPAIKGMTDVLRMGYTVRSADGYRLTQYVPYDKTTHRGSWGVGAVADDLELYDYNTDYWETHNYASNASYTAIVTKLKAVLLQQYTGTNAHNDQ